MIKKYLKLYDTRVTVMVPTRPDLVLVRDQWPVGFEGPYDFVYIISNCLDV